MAEALAVVFVFTNMKNCVSLCHGECLSGCLLGHPQTEGVLVRTVQANVWHETMEISKYCTPRNALDCTDFNTFKFHLPKYLGEYWPRSPIGILAC